MENSINHVSHTACLDVTFIADSVCCYAKSASQWRRNAYNINLRLTIPGAMRIKFIPQIHIVCQLFHNIK